MICSPPIKPQRPNHAAKRKSIPQRLKKSLDDFVLIIPVVREHARISFRKKLPEEQAELIEECVASAFRAYARLLELGKEDLIYPTVLATFAVKQVRDGRLVGGKLNINDVLSRYAQKRKPIKIERLDRYDPAKQAWEEAVVEDSETPVPDQAAFRMDFPAWLKRYQALKRRVVEALALGYTTNEAARRFHLSAGRISQLRREFENSWQVFQGEQTPAVEDSALAVACA
jgi:hypothetical protein